MSQFLSSVGTQMADLGTKDIDKICRKQRNTIHKFFEKSRVVNESFALLRSFDYKGQIWIKLCQVKILVSQVFVTR